MWAFPRFVVLDFQRDGLIIGCGIKLVKLVLYMLKNAFLTGGAKELKCNSHTVKKMTKVPPGFDFSFLNDEEARKILQVLERNEELRRAEKDRIRYGANSFLLCWAWVQQGPGIRGEGAELARGTCPGVLRAAAAEAAEAAGREEKTAPSCPLKDFGMTSWYPLHPSHTRRARLRVWGRAGWGSVRCGGRAATLWCAGCLLGHRGAWAVPGNEMRRGRDLERNPGCCSLRGLRAPTCSHGSDRTSTLA